MTNNNHDGDYFDDLQTAIYDDNTDTTDRTKNGHVAVKVMPQDEEGKTRNHQQRRQRRRGQRQTGMDNGHTLHGKQPRQRSGQGQRQSFRIRSCLPAWHQIVAITCVCLYWYCFVWRTQNIIDAHLNGHTLLDSLSSFSPLPKTTTGATRRQQQQQQRKQQKQQPLPSQIASSNLRFIVFQPTSMGQGLGNILNGLLAVHLLGQEFDRIVCISTDWYDFHQAFQSLQHQDVCSLLPPSGRYMVSIDLVNFGPPPNECRLQKKLASTEPVWYIAGNTYPRWPVASTRGLFGQYYAPTEALLGMLELAYTETGRQERPETVVHLRQPDDPNIDPREGLDRASLEALGEYLKRSGQQQQQQESNQTLSSSLSTPFLVTNNVDLYKYFQDNFGWSHPPWTGIKHSALMNIEWGSTASTTNTTTGTTETAEDIANLQLFADWYTVLQAKRVYHTHSDFSQSAIHWNDIESYTIRGVVNGTLQFTNAPWRREAPLLPLVERTRTELKYCDGGLLEERPFLFDDGVIQTTDDEKHDYQGINDQFFEMHGEDANTPKEQLQRTAERRVFWGLDPAT